MLELHTSGVPDEYRSLLPMLLRQEAWIQKGSVPGLVKLLKAYRPSVGAGGGKQAKQSVTVGVVGYPNVGKSSLINSLKRSKVGDMDNT